MLVAALGAYICTALIHLPGPYSAVITTLIVARPHSGGVLRASLERLIATLLGAGLACGAAFGRLLHVPELLLIALTLAPLALVAAHNTAYRTAMIAAIIVLSAPAASGAPLQVAAARMLGVGLGALIGALVSITIVPSRREVVVAAATAKLLEQYPGLLHNALHPNSGDERGRDKFEFRIRQSLRDLGMLIRDRTDALPTKGPAAAVVKFTVQMHADIAFLKRELPSPLTAPALASLENFSIAFAAIATHASTMARARAAPPDIQQLRDACRQAAQTLHQEHPNSEGARLMLRRLTEDLGSLIHSLERSGVGA
jgi:uncharacterized membrane protein YccC